MYSLLKNNKVFLLLYVFVLLAITPVLFIFPKSNIHIFLNSLHSITFDLFFKYITHVGDGLMPLIFASIFLLFSIRKSLILLTSGLIAGILAQLLKRLVFPDVMRPVKYFEGIHDLHLVEGVKMHSSFSFPSGHAATIFALCFCLAFFTRRTYLKVLLLLLALVVAYSRVYLSQHFLIDAVAGSVLGCLSAIILHIYILGINNSWIDTSLLRLFKKNRNEDE